MNNQAWCLGDLESDNDITALIHPQLCLPAFSFVVFLVQKLLKQHHQDQKNWKSSRHHPSPRASFVKRVPQQWSWIGAQGPRHWSDDLQCSAERHGIVGEVFGTGGNQWQIRKYIGILSSLWNPTLNHQSSTGGCKADFYMKRWLLDESEAGGFNPMPMFQSGCQVLKAQLDSIRTFGIGNIPRFVIPIIFTKNVLLGASDTWVSP